MTHRQIEIQQRFLKKITGIYYDIPKGIITPEGFVTLYNPLLSQSTLFYNFGNFEKQNHRIENVVDDDLYEKALRKLNRHDESYTFAVPIPGSPSITPVVASNVPGLVHSFRESEKQTMTLGEAVLYCLFYQYLEYANPLPDPVITITIAEPLGIPVIIGFDEVQIQNRICLCRSADLQKFKTSKVITRQALK